MRKIRDWTKLPDLAIVGGMGSGKTTAANYLHREYNYRRLHFAGALKTTARTIWGSKVESNRDLLQKFGVAVRGIEEDAWLNVVRREVEEHRKQSGYEPLCVDDCRFPNEYELLEELGFVFIRLDAAEDERFGRLQRIRKIDDREQMKHESEIHVPNFKTKYYYKNTGTDPKQLFDFLDRTISRENRSV